MVHRIWWGDDPCPLRSLLGGAEDSQKKFEYSSRDVVISCVERLATSTGCSEADELS